MDRSKSFPVMGLAFLILFAAGCGVPAVTPAVADTCTTVPAASILHAASAPTEIVDPTSPPGKMLLLYDDDGSRDGMAALLYLLSKPDISIQAITISYGEAHPTLYIQHMGCVLDTFGIRDIPLGAGQVASHYPATLWPGKFHLSCLDL